MKRAGSRLTRELSLGIIRKWCASSPLQLLYGVFSHHSEQKVKNLAAGYPNVGKWSKGWGAKSTEIATSVYN